MNWIGEVTAGVLVGIAAVIVAVFWLAPSTVLGFLPKLWRTWKGRT